MKLAHGEFGQPSSTNADGVVHVERLATLGG